MPKILAEYVESLDVTDWLRAQYGQELKDSIQQVKINQTETTVWVEMTFGWDTDMGRMTRQTYLSLDTLAVAYDKPLDIVPQGESRYVHKIYNAGKPIAENAQAFFSRRALLREITELFKPEEKA